MLYLSASALHRVGAPTTDPEYPPGPVVVAAPEIDMPVRRPLLSVIAAAAVVASGLVTGRVAPAAPVTAGPTPKGCTPPPVVLRECHPSDGFPANVQCGTVTIPLNWIDVAGEKVPFAVTCVIHTAESSQGGCS